MSISALVGVINFLQLAQPNKYPGDAVVNHAALRSSEIMHKLEDGGFFVLVKQLLIFFIIDACVH
jgi:hypothetical protein